MTVTHRRAAGAGRPGGFTWSTPDGAGAIFVPWRDLLDDGRPTDERFVSVVRSLRAYDAAVLDPEFTEIPPLPTPHAELTVPDAATLAAFEAELAERLAAYRRRREAPGG